MAAVCEPEGAPAHFGKMANLLWSATLHATVTHGSNALHEIAAFGLESEVHKKMLTQWSAEGTALADTFAAFARVHLACVRLCAHSICRMYTRARSRASPWMSS